MIVDVILGTLIGHSVVKVWWLHRRLSKVEDQLRTFRGQTEWWDG